LLPIEELRCLQCGYCLYHATGNLCPECGQRFAWDKVYEAAVANHGETFERDWRQKPIASFGRSWLHSAFRPKRLWADLSLFDRPNVAAILVIIAAQWIVFCWGWTVVDELAGRAMTATSNWLNYPARFYYPYRPHSTFMPLMAIWYLFTFVSFGFFFYSFRRSGVSWRHALRVVVYSMTFGSMGMLLWGIGEVLVDSTILLRFATTGASGLLVPARCYSYLALTAALLVLVVTWAHLSLAIRRHLAMSHGWIVSALCLALGQLLAQAAMTLNPMHGSWGLAF
jgi:hypothetical protein